MAHALRQALPPFAKRRLRPQCAGDGFLDTCLHPPEKPLVGDRFVGRRLQLEDIEHRAVGTCRDPRAGDVDTVAGHRPGNSREQPRIIDGQQRQLGDILVLDLAEVGEKRHVHRPEGAAEPGMAEL